MPLGLSRVLFVLDKSALKKLWTPMRSSGGFVRFLELQNGQHNGWPCAHFGSPTRFRRLTAILRTRSIWGARVNLKNTHWLGAHGELSRRYISGLSPAKSGSAKMGANLPHARKGSVEKVASTAESQRACDASHSVALLVQLSLTIAPRKTYAAEGNMLPIVAASQNQSN